MTSTRNTRRALFGHGELTRVAVCWSLAMKHQIQEPSDLKRQEKIQELTDELLMPTGVLAVIALARILIVVFFWKTSGLT